RPGAFSAERTTRPPASVALSSAPATSAPPPSRTRTSMGTTVSLPAGSGWGGCTIWMVSGGGRPRGPRGGAPPAPRGAVPPGGGERPGGAAVAVDRGLRQIAAVHRQRRRRPLLGIAARIDGKGDDLRLGMSVGRQLRRHGEQEQLGKGRQVQIDLAPLLVAHL